MYASFDFHLHTEWSYDACAPVEHYFELARARNVKYIAITEHHQMDSCAEAAAVAERYPDVRYIPGAELTVHSPLGTFDMVCLGLPLQPDAALQKVFEAYHQWQRAFGDAVSQAVTAAGFPYGREERLKLLRRYRPERTIEVQGVTHVQNDVQTAYLVDEMHCFDSRQAFYETLWRHNLPHYPEYSDVLPAVRQAGGLVFIAHPTDYFERDNLARIDALREMLAFDGIECAHDSVPRELTPFYRNYCEKHQLLSTAGTDCHSAHGQAYRFGGEHEFARHIGSDLWRDEILERLRTTC